MSVHQTAVNHRVVTAEAERLEAALLTEPHLRSLAGYAESLTYAVPGDSHAAGVADDLGLSGLKGSAKSRQLPDAPPLPRELVQRLDPLRGHLGDVLLIGPSELSGVEVKLVDLGALARVDVSGHGPAAVESAGDVVRVCVRHGVKCCLTGMRCQGGVDNR